MEPEYQIKDNQIVQTTYTENSTPITAQQIRDQIAQQKSVIAQHEATIVELETVLATVEELETQLPPVDETQPETLSEQPGDGTIQDETINEETNE